MDELYKLLIKRIQELEQIIENAETFLAKAPEGTLRIAHKKNTEQYYIRTNPKDTIGKYIKKSESRLIQDLAQKDYAQKVLAAAYSEKNNMQEFIQAYHPGRIEDVYHKLSQEKRRLVSPYVQSDKEFIVQWEQARYPVKYNPEEGNGIYTENNEVVRSKSEKILADKFKTMKIPYHYEKPLYLDGYGVVYPDFTLLNKRTRKEYYWEHMGLMDNSDYCEKSIKKIETMARNGILQGKNLILTYETSKHPLNMKNVDLLIEEYLI
ncbi:MAG: hypothetical protein Q4D16_23875 [Eubacteriales bacterium]|nr:hypothetical protein [Eubacteriales bacterium]